MSHFPYFYMESLFGFVLHYANQCLNLVIRKGTVCYFVRFSTRSLPFLTELHTLFYVNGVKVIPAFDIMFFLLTPITLAHWTMGEVVWRGSGLTLGTDSFSVI